MWYSTRSLPLFTIVRCLIIFSWLVRMFAGSVVGLSTLRQHEPKSTEPSAKTKELQAYLSKYSGDKSADGNKAKRKKKKVARSLPGGVRIFEEDNTGFQRAPVQEQADVEDEGGSCRAICLAQITGINVFVVAASCCQTSVYDRILLNWVADCKQSCLCRGASYCKPRGS